MSGRLSDALDQMMNEIKALKKRVAILEDNSEAIPSSSIGASAASGDV